MNFLFRLHLLCFPPACRQCGRMLAPLAPARDGFPYLCAACRAGLPWKDPALSCRACGSLTGEPERLRCPVCAEQHFAFSRVWCAFSYHEPVRSWILRLKYRREESLVRMLGRLLLEAPNAAAALDGVHLVLPVPLHRRRLRRRGFNQAYLLAHHWLRGAINGGGAVSGRGAVNAGDTPPLLRADLLRRHRHTRPQVELPRVERQANVAAAFSVGDPVPPESADTPEGPLEGLNVLLVDDLMTTGATLNACAKVLREAGAARVDALVLARA